MVNLAVITYLGRVTRIIQDITLENMRLGALDPTSSILGIVKLDINLNPCVRIETIEVCFQLHHLLVKVSSSQYTVLFPSSLPCLEGIPRKRPRGCGLDPGWFLGLELDPNSQKSVRISEYGHSPVLGAPAGTMPFASNHFESSCPET
jgi:hypothetical protein